MDTIVNSLPVILSNVSLREFNEVEGLCHCFVKSFVCLEGSKYRGGAHKVRSSHKQENLTILVEYALFPQPACGKSWPTVSVPCLGTGTVHKQCIHIPLLGVLSQECFQQVAKIGGWFGGYSWTWDKDSQKPVISF